MTRGRWAPVLLLLIGGLAFANALANPFVADEFVLIVDHPAMREAAPWRLFALPFFYAPSHPPGTHYERYRPLTSLTYWVEYQCWGDRPLGYHVTSLALHLVNGWWLYRLAVALSVAPPAALLGAILFLIHPVQPQAVAYVASRGDLLSGLFLLLALGGYLRRRWAAAWLGYGAALLAKETAFIFPLLVWAYERIYHPAPTPVERQRLRRTLLGFGLVLAAYGVFRQLWLPAGGFQWWARWDARLALFGQTMTQYGQWFITPMDLRFPMAFDPTFPWWVGALWLVVGVGALGWVCWRPVPGPWRPAVFGAAWGILALLPVSNLAFPTAPPFAANYLYLPMIGASVALTVTAWHCARPMALARRWGLAGLGLLWGAWLFGQTLSMNAYWGDRNAIERRWEEVRRVVQANQAKP